MPVVPTSLLLAFDAFKGTLRAAEVTDAVARGLRTRGRDADTCPVADGGEGTLEVLAPELEADLVEVEVAGPTGCPVTAELALATGRRGERVAVVESARASGLGLVDGDELDPLGASTFGTGELIVAAADAGARLIYVGAGGSATTDGGRGALRAIRGAGGIDGVRLVVLCDVRTPFEDAARVFAPQKGADPGQVRTLTRRLHSIAARLPRDPRGIPLTGAAGGLAGGLWAALGAELVAGAPFVLDLVRFDVRLQAARAVVTGEGRLDQQSLAGKVVSEVATRARQRGVPCYAVVGSSELDSFGRRLLDLQEVLTAKTLRALQRAGERLAERI